VTAVTVPDDTVYQVIRSKIMFEIATYCERQSRLAGTTDHQYRAAVKLVEEALGDMRRVDAREIAVTKQDGYRVWWRLKLKGAPSTQYRAIVEIRETDVVLHAVLPRCSSTYETVRKLWWQHRRRVAAVAA
jgi:hypothetical protein